MNEALLKSIRSALSHWEGAIEEKRMFGGTCFLYHGKMCVGETKSRLMVRVPSNKMEELLALPYVKPMDFTGKPLKEFIFVSEAGYDTQEKMQYWVEMGIAHAKTKLTKK
ncbi:MAG TPA: TfoX/Sxy family protein [Flavobacteriaceae bacterium]|nr:TfoX/Sxy family protein [Flavobacteriaceae bacterium]HPF10192.1 TfoX/Sxy family protein [Flavobacteriaceae bacterium]HQU21676.1 TfoX/Sxy family protein [Flavobacteriaceae bacterium]HQU66289.1 TfoX/Sxy family protein [Flavobacteriaceae bacterium]HRW43860.1 TfoX/Sxy family protein [Flavobacteriaceae bacterium]